MVPADKELTERPWCKAQWRCWYVERINLNRNRGDPLLASLRRAAAFVHARSEDALPIRRFASEPQAETETQYKIWLAGPKAETLG